MDLLLATLQNPPEPTITVGAVYGIRKKIKAGSNHYIIVTKRIRAIAKYKNVILFEDDKGVRECFTRWELARVIV